jgi:hypothetical protein
LANIESARSAPKATDPAASDLRAGICFREEYEYLARRGDAAANTPTLVKARAGPSPLWSPTWKPTPNEGDLEDGSPWPSLPLVGSAELHADLAIGKACDRVADVFTRPA